MKLRPYLTGGVVALVIAVSVIAAQNGHVAAKSSDDQVLTTRTFIDLTKQVRPAVVSVKINVETRDKIEQWRRERQARPNRPQQGDEQEVPDWLRDFFEFRGMPQGPGLDQDWLRYPYGAGTGMIIRSDGYVLTNRHVLYHPQLGQMYKDGQITVVLADKREFKGDQVKVVATDLLTDLAVLKIDAKDLPTVKWDKDEVELGEWVMAVGDPMELTGSISQGIISGLGREIDVSGYARLLQTTAVINPGNSGGPLVNLDGEVVGVNNAIASNTRYWQGVGFAIPAKLASKIANDLIDAGHPVRGYIGIRMTDPNEFPAFAAHEEFEGDGVGVFDVYKGYPAAKAGVKPYDIIVEINGVKTDSNVVVQRAITAVRPGDKVTVKVFRGGEYKTLTITAGEWPSEKELAALSRGSMRQAVDVPREVGDQTGKLGLLFEDYPDEPNAKDEDKGAIVRQVRAGSPAAGAGLQVGDVIIEAEKKRVHSAEELAEVVKNRQKEMANSKDSEEATIILKVRRGEGDFLAFMPLSSD